jgi:hypothetical protein
MLLPIFEFWQCCGNQHIPIDDKLFDFDSIRHVLGVQHGGLMEAEARAIKARGYLDLEKDILLPLLTKQANYWEQLCTPRYYTDPSGRRQYAPDKRRLERGEKYLLLPGTSPENRPNGYGSFLTVNTTMDIAAARDGLRMTIALENAVNRPGKDAAVAKWKKLLEDLPDYQYDGAEGVLTARGGGGALREWATQDYQENNNHRHMSHLYAAWPAYDTRYDHRLYRGAKQAVANRDRLNTGDNTTGHGWTHRGLISARLNDAPDVEKVLLTLLSSNIYYNSMVTDHNTNRSSDAYCTDTSIALVAIVNEALAFSYTGDIELLPALPPQAVSGSIAGLMTRTRAEIENLQWNEKEITATIRSDIAQTIRVTSGVAWGKCEVSGRKVVSQKGDEILVAFKAGERATIRLASLARPAPAPSRQE